jgi:hypothetical protein
MHMKKTLILIGMMTIWGLTFAQRHNHNAHNADEVAARKADKMKSALRLNETQYASIKEINKKYAAKVSVLRSDTTTRETERRDQFKEIRVQRENEISKVLSREQNTKWDSIRTERKKNMHNHNYRVGKDAKREALKALNLSEAQSKQLDDSRKILKEKILIIHNDSTLSEQTRKDKVRVARSDHANAVKTILTEDQYQQWKEMKKRRSHKKGLKQEHYFRK